MTTPTQFHVHRETPVEPTNPAQKSNEQNNGLPPHTHTHTRQTRRIPVQTQRSVQALRRRCRFAVDNARTQKTYLAEICQHTESENHRHAVERARARARRDLCAGCATLSAPPDGARRAPSVMGVACRDIFHTLKMKHHARRALASRAPSRRVQSLYNMCAHDIMHARTRAHMHPVPPCGIV